MTLSGFPQTIEFFGRSGEMDSRQMPHCRLAAGVESSQLHMANVSRETTV
jgi:hypothetical protein